MGRARSHEFMEYRSKIMEAICNNERLVRLLTPEEEPMPEDPTETLPYNYLVPYELISGTQTIRGRYLGFDISCKENTYNRTYKEMTIDFFVICNNELIKYPDPDKKGYYRCWYDLVVCELDEMFCGENPVDIGAGKMVLKSNDPYFVSYAREIPVKGRTVTFSVDEFTNGKKYGK